MVQHVHICDHPEASYRGSPNRSRTFRRGRPMPSSGSQGSRSGRTNPMIIGCGGRRSWKRSFSILRRIRWRAGLVERVEGWRGQVRSAYRNDRPGGLSHFNRTTLGLDWRYGSSSVADRLKFPATWRRSRFAPGLRYSPNCSGVRWARWREGFGAAAGSAGSGARGCWKRATSLLTRSRNSSPGLPPAKELGKLLATSMRMWFDV